MASVFICLLLGHVACAAGLSDAKVIGSKVLGYDLEYWVYTPSNFNSESNPALYLTDGQWYLQYSKIISLVDKLIAERRIEPLRLVFISSDDPHSEVNRRNSEFMCNAKYAYFYRQELIPAVEGTFRAASSERGRGIAGMSFGGLNAGCFGLMISDAFNLIGMQSPANPKRLKILTSGYEKSVDLPISFFISAGSIQDNRLSIQRLQKHLKRSGYPVVYVENNYNHNWENWNATLEDMLVALFSVGKVAEIDVSTAGG